jgi:hypothetical protein
VGTESFRDPLAGSRIAGELGRITANSGVIEYGSAQARPRIAHRG